MYLRVYSYLVDLTPDEIDLRYAQREKIEADLTRFGVVPPTNMPAGDYLVVQVRVPNESVDYLPPTGWFAEIADELDPAA